MAHRYEDEVDELVDTVAVIASIERQLVLEVEIEPAHGVLQMAKNRQRAPPNSRILPYLGALKPARLLPSDNSVYQNTLPGPRAR